MQQETTIPSAEEVRAQGRPNAITDEQYYRDIEEQLNSGTSIDEITPTGLFKRVGGSYKRAVALLTQFKAGYEVKAVQTQPEVSEHIYREGVRMMNDLLHRVVAMADEQYLERDKKKDDDHAAELDKKELANLQQQDLIEEQATQIAEQGVAIGGLEDSLNAVIEAKDKLAEEVELLKESLRKSDQELVQKREAVKQQSFRIDDLLKEVADRDGDLAKMRRMYEEALQASKDSSEQAQDYKSEKVLAEKECDRLNKQLDGLDQDFKMLQSAKESKDQLHQELEIKNAKLVSDHENITARLVDLQDSKAVVVEQMHGYMDMLKTREGQIGERDTIINGLRKELDALKSDKINTKKSGK